MQMLAPDLLDRRALALIELVDAAGTIVDAPAIITGQGTVCIAKGLGRYALLSAHGFEDYSSAFTDPPSIARKSVTLDIQFSDRRFASRRFQLPLPRDGRAENATANDSIFTPQRIIVGPTVETSVPSTAAAVRVRVVHKTNKKLVGHALVRVSAANGKYEAQSVTDLSGEALLIIPHFPASFTTAGGAVEATLAGKVTAVGDPDIVQLVGLDELARRKLMPANLAPPFVDPDSIADAFPEPAVGVPVNLSTRRIETIAVDWKPP